ncbi:MAG TPA: hypothetical protein VHX12_01065, partial [Acidisoma sp.]|nr:hypothetical protein [Acidisoma sp.]
MDQNSGEGDLRRVVEQRAVDFAFRHGGLFLFDTKEIGGAPVGRKKICTFCGAEQCFHGVGAVEETDQIIVIGSGEGSRQYVMPATLAPQL